MSAHGWRGWLVGSALLVTPAAGAGQADRPDPVKNPKSPILLDLAGGGTGAAPVGHREEAPDRPGPRVGRPPGTPRAGAPTPGRAGVIAPQSAAWRIRGPTRPPTRHDGGFGGMWSEGPPVEDDPSKQVRYATIDAGLKWGEPRPLTGPPQE